MAFSDAGPRWEKVLQAGVKPENGETSPERSEESDDDSSHSSEAREHSDTGELSSFQVSHAPAAAVLDVLAAEHMHRRDVRIPLAELEGERSFRPAHASATCAYPRDHNHELTPPRPLAQAVGTTCARRSMTFKVGVAPRRSPDP